MKLYLNQRGFHIVEVVVLFFVVTIIVLIGLRTLRSSHAITTSDTIKPQLTGIINRSGPIPGGYGKVVHATTVNVAWSALQSVQDGPITCHDGQSSCQNVIDKSIATARANNTRFFLNVEAGQYAPAWAMDLPLPKGDIGTPGPFPICNDQGSQQICGSMPHWWEANYQSDFANLMAQLAALYDDVPQVAMVGIDSCMTIFNEPMIREANPPINLYYYENAGITTTGDKLCQLAEINAMEPWTHTQSFLSFNPYEQWVAPANTVDCTAIDTTTCGSFTTNEDYTEYLMDYCRQILGAQRCVLGNESVGNNSENIIPASQIPCSDINTTPGTGPSSGPGSYSYWETLEVYNRMYTKIRCLGPPIEMQSATQAKMLGQHLSVNGPKGTIPWAISFGVGGFQPDPDFNEHAMTNIFLSKAKVTTYNNDMAANANPGPSTSNPPDPPGTPTTTTSPTGNQDPTWTWEASTDQGGPGLAADPYTIELSQDPSFTSGVSTYTSDSTLFTTNHLASGTWYMEVKATDIFGDISKFSQMGSVVIDKFSPVVTITSPLSYAAVSGTVTIDTTDTDSSGIANVELLINGNLIATDTTSPYNFSWDSTSVINGPNKIEVKATDNLNNPPTTKQITVRVKNSA